MDEIRKKIAKFSLQLQSQCEIPLWSIANEKLIYAAAIRGEPAWGPRLLILHRLMRLAYKAHLSDWLIFFVGFYRAFSIWWQVKKKSYKKPVLNKFKRIFASFGASSDEYIYKEYLRDSQESTLRINWVTHEGLHELGCPKLFSIIFLAIKDSFGYTRKVKNAIDEISNHATYFLTVCAFNNGYYAFYRAYLRKAKILGISEIAFLVLDIPTFASVDEKIKTIYIQHGLMSLCTLIPNVDRIELITAIEEKYLISTIKNIKIYKKSQFEMENKEKGNVLMLMSINTFQAERLVIVAPLVKWALRMGLEVVIRPTKHITAEEINHLNNHLPNTMLDNIENSFHASLERWRPKFVVAWSSTGLATALDFGCVPISLYSEEESEVWNTMIYPMKMRVIFWPRDQDIIENTLRSDELYKSQIVLLRNYVEKYSDLNP